MKDDTGGSANGWLWMYRALLCRAAGMTCCQSWWRSTLEGTSEAHTCLRLSFMYIYMYAAMYAYYHTRSHIHKNAHVWIQWMCRHVNMNISNIHGKHIRHKQTRTLRTHIHAHMHTYDPSRAKTRTRTHIRTFTQHTANTNTYCNCIWIYASMHPSILFTYIQLNTIQ